VILRLADQRALVEVEAMPRVLNFHRYKRVRLPSGAVYIGRANPTYCLPASKWANPFKLRRNTTAEERAEANRRISEPSRGVTDLRQRSR
jgi:hypothetical protein